MNGGIIWLASYPKSGNTWLRAFLANLFSGGETPFDINRLADFTMSDMRAVYFEAVAKRPFAEIDADSLNRLRPAVHRYLAQSRPHNVFVKTHHAIGRVGEVPTITAEVTAGAIYVIRNPLDVAVSFAHHMNLDLDTAIATMNREENYLETGGRIAAQFISSWRNHVTSWTQAPGLTRQVLRYEDMLDRPRRSFGEVVRFLGVETTPQQLKRAVRFASFDELKAQESKHGFRERSAVAPAFFREGRKDVWRRRLTSAQVDAVVQANEAVMGEYGYLP